MYIWYEIKIDQWIGQTVSYLSSNLASFTFTQYFVTKPVL